MQETVRGMAMPETLRSMAMLEGLRGMARLYPRQNMGTPATRLSGGRAAGARGAWLVAILALAGAPPHASAQSPVERELIQLERDWDAAFFRNDTAFIDRVLAPEFVATYPDGSRGDRNKELSNAASFNQQIESSTLSEFTVQVHGDTAVVWFTRRLVGPSRGRRLLVVHRYLDVFVRRDGRWQCVATQSVRVPDLEQVGVPDAPK
jgi:ketosteroid isomerase-like protein